MIDKSILTSAEIEYIKEHYLEITGHRLYDFNLLEAETLTNGDRFVKYVPKYVPVALRGVIF